MEHSSCGQINMDDYQKKINMDDYGKGHSMGEMDIGYISAT